MTAKTPALLISLFTIALFAPPAAAQPCQCDADLNNDSIISAIDMSCLQQCIRGNQLPGCQEDCDVNCDGSINECDLKALQCRMFGGGLECCDQQRPDQMCGACCIEEGTACIELLVATCADSGGVFVGPETECPSANLVIVQEPGGEIFTHIIGPPAVCQPPNPGKSRGTCVPGEPLHDPWVSPEDGEMCHRFGVGPQSPSIPADFFYSGSESFSGQVCLKGESLGNPEFGDADTIIERTQDPFDRCALPGPDSVTVEIEITALNLVSIAPISVTGNGNTTQWDVQVDLSVQSAPPGSVTARKTHCNGGTFTSTLPVQPRFTFTQVGQPGQVRVLDTGTQGIPPVVLQQTEANRWASDLDPILREGADLCSDFHAGFEETQPVTDCDCNENNLRDLCDIENETSDDDNGNHIPDECEATAVPSSDEVPALTALYGPSPNPFRGTTKLDYSLAAREPVLLGVYDARGNKVATLVDRVHEPGRFWVTWDGRDHSGKRLPAGVYFARLSTRGEIKASKVVVVR